ncbi:phosphate butyryltransferase [Sporosarcina sp. Marseille-Q4063]|uniref:phosphate butyryltransferase n=1 Tax=Sporosarcina sp. Marseille-Q4063 TaxID=2810514 RepID=UPI001BAF4D27|nr:phosphate butyryltransferase [Sporosarcina sp. Marseille-Q4063]QUW22294.1 phosphate butyryltransferase [Sporosarcina sp. Marseille-Q4063]
MTTLASIVEKAAMQDDPIVAVASAADMEVLTAVYEAVNNGIASFILFDDQEKIHHLLSQNYRELLANDKIQIYHTENLKESAVEAVKAVSSGQAHVLMKGNIPTSVLLKEVLNSEYGLRTGKVLSHVAAFEVPNYDRLLFVTDAAMNIAPDLDAKAQIIRNAVATAHACGIDQPIVAPLAAIETINSAMTPTIDAASLVVMNQRGQIDGCIIEGPLALDNAISTEAATQKGITGPSAGKADILVAPNIEAGNILYKSLMYFAQAKVGAVIQGASAPIVLTSRADSAESKLYSLALAILSTSTN